MYANGKTCELCDDLIAPFHEKIDERRKDMLDFLLNHKLDLKANALMCTVCAMKLENFIQFKNECLFTENQINFFVRSEDYSRIDLKEVYLQINKHKGISCAQNDQEVCRFCMRPTGDFFTPLHQIKDDMFFQMLQRYVGEMNLNSTKNPVACNTCLNTLQHYFVFIKNLIVEDKYKETETTDTMFMSNLLDDENVTKTYNNHYVENHLHENGTKLYKCDQEVHPLYVGSGNASVETPVSSDLTKSCIADGNVVTEQPRLLGKTTNPHVTRGSNYRTAPRDDSDCCDCCLFCCDDPGRTRYGGGRFGDTDYGSGGYGYSDYGGNHHGGGGYDHTDYGGSDNDNNDYGGGHDGGGHCGGGNDGGGNDGGGNDGGGDCGGGDSGGGDCGGGDSGGGDCGGGGGGGDD